MNAKKLNKKAEQRVASIENILASALDLFVKKGYRVTTIDEIAAKAGLTKGAVYFYFKTKDAILLRLLDEAAGFIVDPISIHIAEAGPTADAKLVKFIHTQSMLGLTRPEHVLLLILISIEFCGTGNEIETRVRAIYRRMYAAIEKVIAQGQCEGVFRTDLRSRELTAIVMAGHDGVLVEWYRRPREITGKSLANTLRAILLHGLMHKA
ncbi:MAG: TetR/AcrR family transcriptional regulator [Bradyrhizobium sp.]